MQEALISIESGWTGHDQEYSFMNATLQPAGELDFSVATRVEIPASVTSEAALFGHLYGLFNQVVEAFPSLSIEIKLGPSGS